MAPLIIESDDWSSDGANIMSQLPKMKAAIERTVLVLEHWFYRGSRAPRRTFWEEFEELKNYLEKEARPGDLFYFWEFDKACRKDNVLAQGKFPDEKGRVPARGAY
jgi:hypothetical protein